MKVPLPEGEYIKNITINMGDIDIDFAKRKKVALLLIGINQNYWPYLAQVIEDSKKNFLPHHNVDYLIWSDIPEVDTKEYKEEINKLLPDEELKKVVQDTGIRPNGQFFGREIIEGSVRYLRDLKEKKVFYAGSVGWPAPTLMRYHLFLNQEEVLKEYDYVFYLDADMRVVSKISDEILGEGITAAEHPMYSLRSHYIPPYEPNKDSTAYIHRLGAVVDENGKPRFKPYYVAGGFQGGKTNDFIEAMKVMKSNIDKDFDNNYTAIWNDESHWNKYLWDFYKGSLVVLPPSYIYPDSLIKEYYEPIWGRSYEPKIVTLTKPFSLSKDAGNELNKYLGNATAPVEKTKCPTCGDTFETQGFKVIRVVDCPGHGKSHQLEMQKIN